MRPREQLAEHGLSAEDWGGDTLVDVSAVKGDGIDKLLDAILLQAELLELKANPTAALWATSSSPAWNKVAPPPPCSSVKAPQRWRHRHLRQTLWQSPRPHQ